MTRLHVVGVFHTVASTASSHCAFTGKALRFAKMMQAQGYEVIEYANDSESAAKKKVPMLTTAQVKANTVRKTANEFYGKDAVIGSPLWRLFDRKLRRELTRRFDPDHDIVCHPFGHAHQDLAKALGGIHVETGIGYPTTFAPFKVFESYAWMHYHQGKDGRGGDHYEWVIPNYFDLDEWHVGNGAGDYVLFFGRICVEKGMNIVKAIADKTPFKVVVCGQGDAKVWEHPNIEVRPPISGAARSVLLGNARAVIMPTLFTEPFGGSGVEGMLCGTPLIASDHGAFSETVQPGVNGFRCHTLGDYLAAIERAGKLDRAAIAQKAREKYSLQALGPCYDAVFRQVMDLRGEGWYTLDARTLFPL